LAAEAEKLVEEEREKGGSGGGRAVGGCKPYAIVRFMSKQAAESALDHFSEERKEERRRVKSGKEEEEEEKEEKEERRRVKSGKEEELGNRTSAAADNHHNSSTTLLLEMEKARSTSTSRVAGRISLPPFSSLTKKSCEFSIPDFGRLLFLDDTNFQIYIYLGLSSLSSHHRLHGERGTFSRRPMPPRDQGVQTNEKRGGESTLSRRDSGANR
jgi:hypothetical protein